jgi:hypothetical protein
MWLGRIAEYELFSEVGFAAAQKPAHPLPHHMRRTGEPKLAGGV